MKLFVDSADIVAVRKLNHTGLIDGVTTNPSLIAKEKRPVREVAEELCASVEGPVSIEVGATTCEDMLKEGRILGSYADNIVIKLPLTWDGLQACRRLTDDGYRVNVTLCFSANQALMAAKAGAAFVSPFVGRLDDLNINGLQLIRDIKQIFSNYPAFKTEILCASVRTGNHFKEVALCGADIITLPPSVFPELIKHPLTDKGLEAFMEDWKASGLSIDDDPLYEEVELP